MLFQYSRSDEAGGIYVVVKTALFDWRLENVKDGEGTLAALGMARFCSARILDDRRPLLDRTE